jgi:hypothetical protein
VVASNAKAPSPASGKVQPGKKRAKAVKVDPEKAAYQRAALSLARAQCLRDLVDYKARYDAQRGIITDWGSVVTEDVCGKHLFPARK